MKNSKKTNSQITYNTRYEEEFSWAAAAPNDPYSARCTLCVQSKPFRIDTMGRQAFMSHATGKKHLAAEKASKTTPPISVTKHPTTSASKDVHAPGSSSRSASGGAVDGPSLVQSGAAAVDGPSPVQSGAAAFEAESTIAKPGDRPADAVPRGGQGVLEKFLLAENVTKAEISLCLFAVTQHMSLRATGNLVSLFPQIFSDSEIAQRIKLQKDKASYLITFGLAYHFRQELQRLLSEAKHIVVGFDESLNKISQKQQMDVAVRFWNEETNQVDVRYLDSVFLGHTRSEDLLKGLKSAVEEPNMGKLTQ